MYIEPLLNLNKKDIGINYDVKLDLTGSIMKYIRKLLSKIETIPNKYLFGVIFLVAFIIYGNSLFNGFVADDFGQIVDNARVHSLANIPSFLNGATFYNEGAVNLSGVYFLPTLVFYFAINYALWQGSASGFHLSNMLLHATVVSLVFILLSKLFSKAGYKLGKTIAYLLSLIYLVHPANVEAVTYISSIQESILIFLALISLLITMSWCESKKEDNKKLFFIGIFSLLSLFSKETGIIILFVLSLYVFIFYKPKLILYLLTQLSVFTVYLIVRLGIAKMSFTSFAAAPPIARAPLVQRLTTIPFEIFSYLRLLFYPKDLYISQNFIVKSLADPRFFLALPLDVLVIFLILFIAIKLKSNLYNFFLIWLLASFSILLNIYPLDCTITERWLYAPFIPILGITGIIIFESIKKYHVVEKIIIVVILIILPILSLRTIIRNFDWKDNKTLVFHDIKLNPDSYELQGGYATIVGNEGNTEEAKKHYERALELAPGWWVTYTNLGLIYEKEGDFDKAKDLYMTAIKNINDPLAYQNLAVLEFKTEAPRESVELATSGLKYFPNNPTLNFVAALSYYKLGDKISALTYAQKTYFLHPSAQTLGAVQRISGGQSIDDLLK